MDADKLFTLTAGVCFIAAVFILSFYIHKGARLEAEMTLKKIELQILIYKAEGRVE